jgi:hypothetical protein
VPAAGVIHNGRTSELAPAVSIYDLCSGGARFQYLLRRRLSRLELFHDFFQPVSAEFSIIIKWHDHSLPQPLQPFFSPSSVIPNFFVALCFVRFVSFCVLFVCICVLCYCHRVATQLQLTNISHHILFSVKKLKKRSKSRNRGGGPQTVGEEYSAEWRTKNEIQTIYPTTNPIT